jgi:hypothetical protein
VLGEEGAGAGGLGAVQLAQERGGGALLERVGGARQGLAGGEREVREAGERRAAVARERHERHGGGAPAPGTRRVPPGGDGAGAAEALAGVGCGCDERGEDVGAEPVAAVGVGEVALVEEGGERPEVGAREVREEDLGERQDAGELVLAVALAEEREGEALPGGEGAAIEVVVAPPGVERGADGVRGRAAERDGAAEVALPEVAGASDGRPVEAGLQVGEEAAGLAGVAGHALTLRGHRAERRASRGSLVRRGARTTRSV